MSTITSALPAASAGWSLRGVVLEIACVRVRREDITREEKRREWMRRNVAEVKWAQRAQTPAMID
jgi:hypothetical protein